MCLCTNRKKATIKSWNRFKTVFTLEKKIGLFRGIKPIKSKKIFDYLRF